MLLTPRWLINDANGCSSHHCPVGIDPSSNGFVQRWGIPPNRLQAQQQQRPQQCLGHQPLGFPYLGAGTVLYLYCIFLSGFLRRGFTALNFQSSHPVSSIHSFHSIPKKISLEISPIFQQPSHILRQGHGNNGRNRNNRHRQNWNGGGHGNAGGHGHGGHNEWHNSWQPWPHLGAYNFIYSMICIIMYIKW